MKFTVITDTHLVDFYSAYDDNIKIIDQFIQEEAPDAILNIGDITSDGRNNPAQYDHAHKVMIDLGKPFYAVPGNHDVGDNPRAPGFDEHDCFDTQSLAAYRAVFGTDYWHHQLDGWNLVGINAQLFGTGSTAEVEQWAWLETLLPTLQGSIGLLSHKPLFLNTPDETLVHVRYVPVIERARLLQLFAGTALKFVLSGHAHQARNVVFDGVEHIWVPSTAFCMPDAMQDKVGDKVVGLVSLTLEDDGSFAWSRPEVAGLVRHNPLHHDDIHPFAPMLREKFGAGAEF